MLNTKIVLQNQAIARLGPSNTSELLDKKNTLLLIQFYSKQLHQQVKSMPNVLVSVYDMPGLSRKALMDTCVCLKYDVTSVVNGSSHKTAHAFLL